MNKRTFFSFLLAVLGTLVCSMSAQTLTNYAKQHKLELAERQKMEKSNYEKACQRGTLAGYNDYLTMYPKGKYVQDIRRRVAELEKKNEQDLYEYAAKEETVQAYEEYLKKYPNGRYVQEAKARLEDMELWKKARSVNTIVAYRDYLSTSKNKSFAQLANDAITDLESKDAWEAIMHSSSESIINNFIQNYPKSSCIPDANKRLSELKAVELYEQGDLLHAFDKFEAAGGRYSIESSNRQKYDECLEYVEFKKINSSSSESVLLAFLKKYPLSKYYNQVSNLVAIAKSKNFTMNTSSYTFNEAMSYAKDKATKNTVQSCINSTRRSYRKYNRGLRHNRVMANGGYVKFGFEIMDFGISTKNESEDAVTMYYNIGASIKFGNYKSPIQLEVGIKPGIVAISYKRSEYHYYGYGYSYNSEIKETTSFFHMPIYARLKLNICDAGDSKFYIAGIGTYNAARDKKYENEYSVGGGMGIAWKKWDWFALYYKEDLENKYHFNDGFIGTSFIYYF